MPNVAYRWLLVVLLVLAVLPTPVVTHAQDAGPSSLAGRELGGTRVAGIQVFYDQDLPPEVLVAAAGALETSLADVPSLTELPPFTTPITAYILADDERFRLALAEIGGVRVDLVAEEIGGYTIERDGRMLVFFAAENVAYPPSALLGYAHELAHLAVREATQRRAVPQWFNEGYASWIAERVVRGHYPAESVLQRRVDRLDVASALHTRGMIPWVELVTRTRFSRAGVEGLANLAYGQSTMFIDFLAERHGNAALARFLKALGTGQTATPAFAAAFGPFAAESEAFEQALVALKMETPPGLYVVQRPEDGRPSIVAVVGGTPGETAFVSIVTGGEVRVRREIDLDGAGLLIASVPHSLLDEAGTLVRVNAPGLGLLEIDPANGTRVVAPSTPATVPSTPQPPVQLPRGSGSLGDAEIRAA